ncbi:hypothetical protein DMENIID0001_036230 [Sergentomyia squamirostris]
MAMLTVQGTESVVRIDGNLSQKFGISSGLRQGDLLSPLLFNFALEAVVRGVCKTRRHHIQSLSTNFGICGPCSLDWSES